MRLAEFRLMLRFGSEKQFIRESFHIRAKK